MGALANAGKYPLGLAWSILMAQYTEETDAVRRWEVQRAEASLMEFDAWLLRIGKPPLPDRIWAENDAYRIRMRVRPGERCRFRDGQGRCRGVSHRFALYAWCPKHHGKKYQSGIQSPP